MSARAIEQASELHWRSHQFNGRINSHIRNFNNRLKIKAIPVSIPFSDAMCGVRQRYQRKSSGCHTGKPRWVSRWVHIEMTGFVFACQIICCKNLALFIAVVCARVCNTFWILLLPPTPLLLLLLLHPIKQK